MIEQVGFNFVRNLSLFVDFLPISSSSIDEFLPLLYVFSKTVVERTSTITGQLGNLRIGEIKIHSQLIYLFGHRLSYLPVSNDLGLSFGFFYFL